MAQYIELHLSSNLIDNKDVQDYELKILEQFYNKCLRIVETKLVKEEQYCINCSISYTREGGMKYVCEIPPEEIIAEFIMVFRFFYLQKEPTHYPKVLSILGKYNQQKEAKAGLKEINARWNNCLFHNAINLGLNGAQLTSSKVLDLWFNAHYFHSDLKKEEELELQRNVFSDEFSKYMMLDGAMQSTKMILGTFNVVKKILKK